MTDISSLQSTVVQPRKVERQSSLYLLENVKCQNGYFARGGAILFTIYNGKIFFLLGVHSKTNELTDFGGNKTRKDRTIFHAVKRELREETNGIFQGEKLNFEKSVCVVGNYPLKDKEDIRDFNDKTNNENRMMTIVFVRINHTWLTNARIKFASASAKIPNDEISDIKWLEEHDFILKIFDKRTSNMYSRVQSFLSKLDYRLLRYCLFNDTVEINEMKSPDDFGVHISPSIFTASSPQFPELFSPKTVQLTSNTEIFRPVPDKSRCHSALYSFPKKGIVTTRVEDIVDQNNERMDKSDSGDSSDETELGTSPEQKSMKM